MPPSQQQQAKNESFTQNNTMSRSISQQYFHAFCAEAQAFGSLETLELAMAIIPTPTVAPLGGRGMEGQAHNSPISPRRPHTMQNIDRLQVGHPVHQAHQGAQPAVDPGPKTVDDDVDDDTDISDN